MYQQSNMNHFSMRQNCNTKISIDNVPSSLQNIFFTNKRDLNTVYLLLLLLLWPWYKSCEAKH